MTITRPLSNLALATMALPVVVGTALCYVSPEKAGTWAIGMFFLPVLWLTIKAAGKTFGLPVACAAMMEGEKAGDARKALSGSMIFASLLIAMTLSARLAEAFGLIDASSAHPTTDRIVNVFVGGYLVFHGNRLPKILTPSVRCDPALMQTLRRRTGWAYVVGGFTLAVIWLALPAHLARPLGMAAIVGGVLLPSLIMMWFYMKRRGAPS